MAVAVIYNIGQYFEKFVFGFICSRSGTAETKKVGTSGGKDQVNGSGDCIKMKRSKCTIQRIFVNLKDSSGSIFAAGGIQKIDGIFGLGAVRKRCAQSQRQFEILIAVQRECSAEAKDAGLAHIAYFRKIIDRSMEEILRSGKYNICYFFLGPGHIWICNGDLIHQVSRCHNNLL